MARIVHGAVMGCITHGAVCTRGTLNVLSIVDGVVAPGYGLPFVGRHCDDIPPAICLPLRPLVTIAPRAGFTVTIWYGVVHGPIEACESGEGEEGANIVCFLNTVVLVGFAVNKGGVGYGKATGEANLIL